jgi:hypothetical protein
VLLQISQIDSSNIHKVGKRPLNSAMLIRGNLQMYVRQIARRRAARSILTMRMSGRAFAAAMRWYNNRMAPRQVEPTSTIRSACSIVGA